MMTFIVLVSNLNQLPIGRGSHSLLFIFYFLFCRADLENFHLKEEC